MRLTNGKYSEQVSITDEEAHDEYSVESKCEFKIGLRYKDTITLAPAYKPTRYWDRIIAYGNSTRRRHVSGVEYWPGTKMVNYAETVYASPKRVENSFLSTLTRYDRHTTRWYKTSMDLEPRVFRAPSVESTGSDYESAESGVANGVNGCCSDSE